MALDIQQLIGSILEKHEGDEGFQKDAKEDSQGAIIKHFGEEAMDELKKHVDEAKLKEMLGKADFKALAGHVSELFGK